MCPRVHSLRLFDMFSAAQEDELGETYLTNVDFLKNGIPASLIACLVSPSRSRVLTGVSIWRTIGGRYRWVCIDETYWVGNSSSVICVETLSL